MIQPPTQDERLTIQEMATRSGFSEHTLRYYERIGLIAPIDRDTSSKHRRYSGEVIDIIESLACLRKTGFSIKDMRTFLELLRVGDAASDRQKELFASHKRAVAEEIAHLRLRQEYLAGKVAYWDARSRGDVAAVARLRATNKQIASRLLA